MKKAGKSSKGKGLAVRGYGAVNCCPPSRMTKQDLLYQGQDDARTIANAKAIMSDPKRMKMASVAAKQLAGEQIAKARAMLQVAKSGSGRKATSKSAAKSSPVKRRK